MAKVKLDPQEAELLRSYEAGEWYTIDNFDAEAQMYAQHARAAFKKDRRVNIRISSHDLERIQIRALEDGLPYQTLMASILHKYVSGRLVEQTARV